MTRFNGSVLVVSDPHQGQLALDIVRRFLPQAELVSWERGTSKQDARTAIRRGPNGQGGQWDVVFSFNNDLVFQQEDLDAMGELPLNIHPSLIRGLGYNTWPIIYGHEEFGVLLHFITLDVDNGPIIERLARPLPTACDFSGLRLRFQVLALSLLHKVAQHVAGYSDAACARTSLMAVVEGRSLRWSEEYVSGAARDEVLEHLRASEPEHPVFRGMPGPGESPANVIKLPSNLSDPDAAIDEVLSGVGYVTHAG